MNSSEQEFSKILEESSNGCDGETNQVVNAIDHEDYDSDSSTELGRICTSPSVKLDNEKHGGEIDQPTFNAIEFLVDSLKSAMGSVNFDKALVMQSKMAGEIHNKSQEIIHEINHIEDTIKEHAEKYERLKAVVIPGIKANLKKSEKLADKLSEYMREQYPVEYSRGRTKILENLTKEEEGLFQ